MFVVMRVAAAPEHLRGYISRFMVEIAAGTYVGSMNVRVAEALWERAERATEEGTDLVMVTSHAQNEQGYEIHIRPGQKYDVKDLDGLFLVSREVNPREIEWA